MSSNFFGVIPQAMEKEDIGSHSRKWEEMDHDVLVKIFQCFDIFGLTSGIGQVCSKVCSTWRLAACDPLIWKTLDLSMLKSNFIKTPSEPYVYVDGPSDKTLTRVLKISLSLSHGNITTLIFHYNLFVSDDQLTYTAESWMMMSTYLYCRCPRLKRLVMPAWNRIKKTGICKAICAWKDLESLTMPSISNPPYLIEEIGKNCKNFAELKIMGPCHIFFASTLAAFLPNLKVLSIRCSIIFKDALNIILDDLKKLEVLNISHCVLIDSPPTLPRRVLGELDESILKKAKRLRKFITCMNDSCITCKRTRQDEGLMRWYKYEADFWKVDEVKSLAI
ncbi:F-box/LRR-repeat protein At3g48880 isoform X1 [Olea europaea var. sylvestris]|uniref:F-box/LRR-repeat protein At3g48880 isoform X1 n=1 Tax=Olea europaea var. sylvestris TaxID=158386 RepID=UPI000C1CFCE1|nr:F-box/LRR-repeat protein At3g48880 isoform X1 [Olea europaea var. sylvestris]